MGVDAVANKRLCNVPAGPQQPERSAILEARIPVAMSDHKELYSAPPSTPQNGLQPLETQRNAQSLQFMIDCLPAIHEAIARCWKGDPLKVLDVGTAGGAGANLLANLYAGGIPGYRIKVDVLEPTSRTEASAQARYPFIHYISADVADLPPVPDWDIILCSHMLERVEGPADFLQHLQHLARSLVLIYSPYNDTDRTDGHINTGKRERAAPRE